MTEPGSPEVAAREPGRRRHHRARIVGVIVGVALIAGVATFVVLWNRDSSQQVSIEEALRDFAEAALELLHGGWENSDGASGSVIFECPGDTVRIEHTTYFTDSDHEETTL